MIVDRLAAMREQQVPVTRSSLADTYEMSGITDPSVNRDGMHGFYSEILSVQNEIKNLRANVDRIGTLHARSLEIANESSTQSHATQLELLVEETRVLITSLKHRITDLEMQMSSGRVGQIQKQQISLVRSKLKETIQYYQTVEQEYRSKYKQRIERQFKIVKPDASPEELRAVVDSENGGQIFSQALLDSKRYDASRGAYLEVQVRHENIKTIEKTLSELAQLLNDLSEIVRVQDDTVKAIEAEADVAVRNMEAGVKHTDKAIISARSARKKRQICFAIVVLLILVIVGIIIGIGFKEKWF